MSVGKGCRPASRGVRHCRGPPRDARDRTSPPGDGGRSESNGHSGNQYIMNNILCNTSIGISSYLVLSSCNKPHLSGGTRPYRDKHSPRGWSFFPGYGEKNGFLFVPRPPLGKMVASPFQTQKLQLIFRVANSASTEANFVGRRKNTCQLFRRIQGAPFAYLKYTFATLKSPGGH